MDDLVSLRYSLRYPKRELMMQFMALLAVSALLGGGVSPVQSAASSTPVHILPRVPSSVQKSLDKIKQHDYQAIKPSGRPINVPAHLVDVQSFTTDWVSPDAAGVPPFPEPIPEQLRKKVQLFYSGGEYESSTGWMVVPRSWVLSSAGIGSDETSFEFTSPKGPDSGWMSIALDYCPRPDCALNDLAGLLPAASSVLREAYKNRNFSDTLPPNVKVDPKPTSISHPNPCAALFNYTRGRTVIHGAVLFDGDDGDIGDVALYITEAGTTKEVANYITNTFIQYQTRRDFHCPISQVDP